MNLLTRKRVEALRNRPGRYGDGAGLYLEVFSPNSASWFLRYRRKGIERWLGLGRLHTFGLIEARDRARRARVLLADGIDPLEKRRTEAARSISFSVCAQQYFEAHERGWSNAKHKQQFINTLKEYAFPKIGHLPVADIDERLVLSVLRPIWTTKTVTAGRVRGRIESVLNYAIASKYRPDNNPARWVLIRPLLPQPDKIASVKHLSALHRDRMPEFMAALRAVPGVAARALEFCILTCARTNEVVRAQWAEIDTANKVWIIPGERMKAGKEHRVPLAPRALALLDELHSEEGNPHLFIGAHRGATIGDRAMRLLMRRLNAEITVHGFRSTFSDWANETTSFPHHVIEQALAHKVGTAVERAYRRGDLFEKRRKLMNAWADFCARPAVVAEVVPLRSARQ